MAEAELSILLKMKDQASKELGKVTKDLNSMSKQLKVAGVAMMAFGGAIVGGLAMAVKAAAEEEKGIVRLSAALSAINVDYNSLRNTLEGKIAATQKASAYSDGELRDALTELVTITGDYDKSLNSLSIAMDLARGKNMDLSSAAMLIGRVIKGDTTLLKRYGIEIRDGATATEALGDIQKRFTGQAEAYGNSTAGAIDKIKNSFDDLKESIGIILLPTVKELADKLTVLIDKFNALPDPLKDFIVKGAALIAMLAILLGSLSFLIGSLSTIGKAIGWITGLFGGASGAASGLVASLGSIVTAITPIIAVIVVLIAQIIGAYIAFKHWAEIPDWLKGVVVGLLGIPGIIFSIIKAFEWLGDMIDKLLRKLGIIKVPTGGGIVIPESGSTAGMQFGGIVPGMRGQPVPILAHGGEVIESGLHGGMGSNVYVTVMGSVVTERDLADTIRREIIKTQYRNYSSGIA